MEENPPDALGLIGGTPLVRLDGLLDGPGPMLVGKLEQQNPGGSVKDRIALSMIRDAERRGLVSPGDTIVEATSGNTGLGLATVAAVRDYRVVLTMPEDMSRERKALFSWYGVELMLTPAIEGMSGAVFAAESLEEDEGYFWPRQFENPANPQAHYETTGPELWQAAGKRLTAVVIGVGTGGTLTGVGRYLKEQKPQVEIIAVEPARAAVLSGERPGPHQIQGIGAGFVPGVLDRSLIDAIVTVEDDEAFEMAARVAAACGLSVGPSSGAALQAASKAARRYDEDALVAAILPDGGGRYISMMDAYL